MAEYTKIDPAFKERWVKALRSGDYEQGHGALCNSDGLYCCLGVACDVYDNTKWIKETGLYSYMEEDVKAYLPDEVSDTIGLSLTVEHSLVRLNDNDGLSFNDIANWIEKNL